MCHGKTDTFFAVGRVNTRLFLRGAKNVAVTFVSRAFGVARVFSVTSAALFQTLSHGPEAFAEKQEHDHALYYRFNTFHHRRTGFDSFSHQFWL
jgi:hypothetical protein